MSLVFDFLCKSASFVQARSSWRLTINRDISVELWLRVRVNNFQNPEFKIGLPKSWIQDFGSPKSWSQDFGSPKSWIQDFGNLTLTLRHNSMKTRPSVRVHWVACGTCSVPGNFFQVRVCSRYNARSDWLIVTGPRADYGLAKTKQKVIQKPYNKLLTNRASSSRTGEYWPWVVFVRTSLLSVRTATTSGQYFPGSTALALS